MDVVAVPLPLEVDEDEEERVKEEEDEQELEANQISSGDDWGPMDDPSPSCYTSKNKEHEVEAILKMEDYGAGHVLYVIKYKESCKLYWSTTERLNKSCAVLHSRLMDKAGDFWNKNPRLPKPTLAAPFVFEDDDCIAMLQKKCKVILKEFTYFGREQNLAMILAGKLRHPYGTSTNKHTCPRPPQEDKVEPPSDGEGTLAANESELEGPAPDTVVPYVAIAEPVQEDIVNAAIPVEDVMPSPCPIPSTIEKDEVPLSSASRKLPKVYACAVPACGYTTIRFTHVERHMKSIRCKGHVKTPKTPKPPKTFNCSKCPRTFNQRYLLKNHMARDHSEGPQKFHCDNPTCNGKTFACKVDLSNHIRNHIMAPCKFCSKVLRQKGMERHYNTCPNFSENRATPPSPASSSSSSSTSAQ